MALLPLAHASGGHSSHLPAQPWHYVFICIHIHKFNRLNLDPVHSALALKLKETRFINAVVKTHQCYVSQVHSCRSPKENSKLR